MKATYVALGAVLAAGAGFFFGRMSGPDTKGDAPADAASDVQGPPDGQYRVVVGRSPQKGANEALVTIVAFVDYEDEGTAEAQPILDKVVKRYGSKVRVVYKQNPDPAHTKAIGAAEAALAAHAQEKFWPMHRQLVKGRTKLDRAGLEAHAKAAGLDLARFRSSLDQHEHARMVESDMRMAARFGIHGSPMFFVQGFPLAGVQPFEAFTRLVDRELPKAQRLVAGGVPADRVYAQALREAKRAVNDEGTVAGGPPERTPGLRPQAVERPDTVYRVPIDGAPTKGPATALVTIVEYTDFQCPYCGRVRTTVDELLKAYPGKVRLVHKMNPLPMHEQAFPAAEAAMAAHAQGKYWQMEALLFGSSSELSPEKYSAFARQIGLDVARFERELSTHAWRDEIHAQQELAAQIGARGTPVFFLNGRKMPGAAPLERFRARIDEEIARAEQAMRTDRVPAAGIYEHLTKNGATQLQTIANPASAEGLPGRPAARALGRPDVGALEEVPPPRTGGGGGRSPHPHAEGGTR